MGRRESPPHVVPTIGDEVPRRAWLRFMIYLGLFTTVIVLALVTDVRDRLTPDEIRATLERLGLWAPLAVLALYTVRPIILVPLTPLWIGSGAFFGWIEGGLWSTIGTVVGGVIGLTIARRLGRDFLEARLGSRLGRWSRMGEERAFRTLFLLKLNPLVPDDLINNLAGVSRVSYGAFALATLVGTGPVIFVYCYIGSTVWEFPSPRFWIAAGILTTVTLTMLLWNRIARLWRFMTRARGGAT